MSIKHRSIAWFQSAATRGFTIVELMIVLAVSGILVALLFGPLDDLYTANRQGLQATVATADIRTALQSIRQTAVSSYSFDDTNGIAPDPSGKVWTGDGSVLIANNYATWMNAGKRTLLNGGTDCSPVLNQLIFFVKDKTLYRRTLTLKGVTPACGGGDWGQKTTCAAGTARPPGCAGTDARLLGGVESFKVDYYPSSSGSTTTTSPDAAKAVQVTITQKGSGDARPVTSKIRINRTNGS